VWQRIKQSPDWRYVGAVILFMLLLQVIGPETLRYERDWRQSGQVYRLLTGHWVHVGWTHWSFNSISLVIMASLTTPGWSIRRWLVNTVALALGISVLIYLFNPEVRDFAGHSGVLYGLFILGAVSLFRRDRIVAVLVAAAIIVKVLMEQFDFMDFNTSDFIGARVIIDSHMYGAILAIAIALVQYAVTMNQGPTEQSN